MHMFDIVLYLCSGVFGKYYDGASMLVLVIRITVMVFNFGFAVLLQCIALVMLRKIYALGT